ncbi:MAG: response regulator [Clostridia bacterium]|nr:response regulator [Clostridia bacterium]
MMPVRLGAAIRLLRTKKGMTQRSLAEALHVTDKAVSKWERGLCVPDICLIPSLAKALGVSVGDLFLEGSNDDTPSHLLQIYEKSADVRTPLHIILGCVDLISRYRDDPELFKRYRDSIKISGEYLLSVFEKAQNTEDLHHLLSEKNLSRCKPFPTANFSGKRFLVVEDMEVNRDIAAEILRDTGAAIEFAEDGLECVERVASVPAGYYDLILMDIRMPNMDGLAATQKLRQMGVTVPIIAMTANVSQQDKQAALNAGMNAFTEKPVLIDQFFSTIHEWLKE